MYNGVIRASDVNNRTLPSITSFVDLELQLLLSVVTLISKILIYKMGDLVHSRPQKRVFYITVTSNKDIMLETALAREAKQLPEVSQMSR